MNTVFPSLSLNRNLIRWEEYVHVLTPVERRGNMWYKREDYFAPLGYGGANGSKLRQLIYLLKDLRQGGTRHVVSAASIKSPQLSMSTLVARHYGLTCTQVIGATHPETALKRPNVLIAARLGAEFYISPVAYNPVLQNTARRLCQDKADWWMLPYGIGLPQETPTADLRAFHGLGGEQVLNLPPIKDLLVPFGSGYTGTSILYGLSQRAAQGVAPMPERIHLFEIGPSRRIWLSDRLEKMIGPGPVREILQRLVWHPLQASGFTDYQQEMRWEQDGIVFHPTYEGKVMAYLNQKLPELIAPSSCFWIVGGPGSWDAMAPHLPTPLPDDALPARFSHVA